MNVLVGMGDIDGRDIRRVHVIKTALLGFVRLHRVRSRPHSSLMNLLPGTET